MEYLQGFAAKHTNVPPPTSFATEGSVCGIATCEACLRWRNIFELKLIIYITCKIILVLFSTNFILALSRSLSEFIEDIRFFYRGYKVLWRSPQSVCGGKKNNKKLTNLKIFSIYLNNYILSKINLYFCFYIWGFAPYPTSFVATKKQKGYIWT